MKIMFFCEAKERKHDKTIYTISQQTNKANKQRALFTAGSAVVRLPVARLRGFSSLPWLVQKFDFLKLSFLLGYTVGTCP